jgi:predicted nucleic acid-binding protein
MIAVTDASVALKWFVQESDAVQAVLLRERHITGHLILAAPDLLLYEVGNALRYKRDFSTAGIQAALSDLLHLHLELVNPTERLLHHAAEMAHQTRLTFYDALYLAVARELNTRLITADKRLHEAAGKMVPVTLLSDANAL